MFFDYEKVAEALVSSVMEKTGSPKAIGGFMGMMSEPSNILPALALAMGGMAGYNVLKDKVDDHFSENSRNKSRERFFKLHPELKDDPEAWEQHDFITRIQPEYKNAPLQMGKIIKNLRAVDHYITPSVFEAKGKKSGGFADPSGLKDILGLMEE